MAFDFSKITSALSLSLGQESVSGVIGVDFGSSALRIVQIKIERNVPVLETYGELQLGPYANTEAGKMTNLDPIKLAEAFTDVVRESGASSTNVAMTIPLTSSFVTIIPIEGTEEEKISATIPVLARKYVPVPLDEVTLDWFMLSNETDSENSRIFLAAILEEAVNKYQTVMAQSTMNVLYNEIEMFSAIRASVKSAEETIAVIDLGVSSTKIYLVKEGLIDRTHTVRLGGAELSQTIARKQEIDFATAEEMKIAEGIAGDPAIRKIVRPLVENKFQEIQRMLAKYETDMSKPIDRVALCGGTAQLKGLEAFAKDALQRDVQFAHPFAKVSYPAFMEDTLKVIGPSFTVAIGAALRHLTESS